MDERPKVNAGTKFGTDAGEGRVYELPKASAYGMFI